MYSTADLNGERGILKMTERENVLYNEGFIPLESNLHPSITSLWEESCSEMLLVSGRVTGSSRSEIVSYIDIRRKTGEVIDTFCPFKFPDEHAFGYSYGFASYDSYIQVCELQIDLDTDNSGSRFGPHYWQDARCTRAYPIADDVSTRSLVGDIDSVTVKLRTEGSQVGFDRLSIPATDRLVVRNYGDTVLHLVATERSTDFDFAFHLPRVVLETTAGEVIPGERIVEVYAYAGGLRSDQARTFVQVPNGGDAGTDAELIACAGDQADLFEALGPRARQGGTWFPNLNVEGLWDPNEQEYGIYRYTVPANDCPPDTAYVTVSPPTPFKQLLPYADTSISLCANKTFRWDVAIPQVGSVVWEDGTTDLVRSISGSGFYTGTVTDAGGCLSEEIFLKVSDASAIIPSNSLERNCVGDTVILASGFALTTDSTVLTSFDRGLLCDSIHRTIYRFRPPVETIRTSTICLGDSLTINDQIFTTAGDYDLELPDGPCGTLLRLELTTSPPDTVYLDTVLRTGEILEIEGVTYDTAGNYLRYFPDAGDCGQVLVIDLDFSTSTNGNNPSNDFWYPTLLRAGTDRLGFHPRAAGSTVVVERLEVYDLGGRLIARSANRPAWAPKSHLPSGIYLFRARLSVNGASQVVSGKVLLTR
jgi:hypothetical protein